MIKNIIFDIGNVILQFDIKEVIPNFTKKESEKQFIINNIINSPEWLQYSLIDTGFISREQAIEIVEDRTNHINDELIEKFWYRYNDYSFINDNVIDIIKELKEKDYKIYLLSNINSHTYNHIKDNKLFNLVDGYVFSYIEHQVKPYVGIYNTLLERYKLIPRECLFIDDNIKNIKTANELGIQGKKVIPDNFESVVQTLKEYNIL
jgi:HAD superfamily hydrolase (TIGR01509 family)